MRTVQGTCDACQQAMQLDSEVLQQHSINLLDVQMQPNTGGLSLAASINSILTKPRGAPPDTAELQSARQCWALSVQASWLLV